MGSSTGIRSRSHSERTRRPQSVASTNSDTTSRDLGARRSRSRTRFGDALPFEAGWTSQRSGLRRRRQQRRRPLPPRRGAQAPQPAPAFERKTSYAPVPAFGGRAGRSAAYNATEREPP